MTLSSKTLTNTVEFIREVFNQPDSFIPLHEPRFIGKEKEYLVDCLESTFVSSVGRYVDEFEEKISSYLGVKRAVACVNGTSALHIALVLGDVKPGDLVITQPLTFVATCNAISYAQASPLFIDVDGDTMGLSPIKLEEFLNSETEQRDQGCFHKATGKRIAACTPMHTFGHPARIDAISEICQRYNITLVEDAAESIGSQFKGKLTGGFGKIAAISFNGNKTITCGGGGVVVTDDEELANLAKHLTTQAKVPHAWDYQHDHVGYNYRMPNLNAALACAQLEMLDQFLANKRQLADLYKGFFKDQGLQFVDEPQDCSSNYWLNALLLDSPEQRDQFLEHTNGNGVMTRPVWKLMTELPMYEHCLKGDLEQAKFLEERIVNIPSSVRVS